MNRRKFIVSSVAAGVAGSALSSCASTKVNKELSTNIMPLAERQKWLGSFSCNIEMWFKHLPFLDRINAAKKMGFNAVEFWDPNSKKKAKNPTEIAKRAKDQGITITSFSPGAPSLADASNHNKFIEWTQGTIELCELFGVPNFNLTGHNNIKGQTEQQNIEIYTQAIKLAAPIFEKAQVMATIEPYNPFNHPGHFINGVEPGLSICREVNSASIKLNWDFFHMQRTNGNLITHMENGFDQIGYIQLADSPNRHQPGTEEVAYGAVLSRLRELGYKGYIGAECFPKDKDDQQAALDLANLAKSISLSPPTI
ncbi:TIM barrel protein [Paraglaciecola aquimarina]|uniref:TIM barrel protein n=1 Tax=Paraglaciecola algarum TaxID=3050085 RepID=A0ABS9D2A3_9ALTE|nr:TIM barrel protein [Paraglaciecola sp. G1-23]MCF2947041.1 TIM barrel protein [Paraglaciecola sp. G1-23]